MDQLCEAIVKGLNLGAGNLPLITTVTFWYKLNGDANDYVMVNGETDLDGISASRNGSTITITRVGANLDIQNTSGSSVTVNALAITGGPETSGIGFRTIIPETTIADIIIPDGQVARISDISFNLTKQP